jgi:hypothetical protein
MHKQVLEGDLLQNLTLEDMTTLLVLYHHHNHRIELQNEIHPVDGKLHS